MKKIDVKSLQDNVFSLIGDRWMLITAGTVIVEAVEWFSGWIAEL